MISLFTISFSNQNFRLFRENGKRPGLHHLFLRDVSVGNLKKFPFAVRGGRRAVLASVRVIQVALLFHGEK